MSDFGIVSENSNASRLWSLVNHYKFIENDLILGYRSSGNYRIQPTLDFRCGSIDGQSRGREPSTSRNTLPIPPEVKSIFSDSNMEIQIQMYGNLFVPITLINHGYASILIPFEPRSRYKVIPRLTVPAGTTCDKLKIVPPSPSETGFLRFAAKTISGTQEFYPTALTSSNNFLLKQYSVQRLRIILSNFTAGDDGYLLLGATNIAAHETVRKR